MGAGRPERRLLKLSGQEVMVARIRVMEVESIGEIQEIF